MNNPLLARFVPEARDLIQASATGLLKLEKDPHDKGTINEVFRAVHTLKGSSGLFDALALTKLVHAAEDLLDAVRSDAMELDSDLVDMLLDSLDQVGHWIDHLERYENLPLDAQGVASEMVVGLRARFESERNAEGFAGAGAVLAIQDNAAAVRPKWLDLVGEDDRLAAFARIGTGQYILAVRYEPEQSCFYNGEDPLNLVMQEPSLTGLRIEARSVWSPLTDLDPYQCNLRFVWLTTASRHEIEHLFRYVLEQVTIASVTAAELVRISGDVSECPVRDDFVEEARRLLAADDLSGLRAATETLLGLVARPLWISSALRWLNAALACEHPDKVLIASLVEAISEGAYPALADAPTAVPPEPDNRDDLVYSPDSPASAVPLSVSSSLSPIARRILSAQRQMIGFPGLMEARIASAGCVLANIIANAGLASAQSNLEQALSEATVLQSAPPLHAFLDLLDVPQAVQDASADPPVKSAQPERPRVDSSSANTLDSAGESKSDGRAASKMLKVDQGKIDFLMNLIGELIVSKNSLPFLAKRAEEVYGSRDMSREIKDQYTVVDRLAQEMQSAIMQVRMLPVSDVFDRFPRLVRDLARKLGKKIELSIEGEETAADKTLIEALGDPLLHIVRNSLDHGIELPEERLAAGKKAEARILLRAFQEADQVVIEIADDGRGIHPDKIRAAAVAKGVVDAQQAAGMSDQEAVNLIFHPGFSTAREISDLSGRGVGMDVVLTTIQKLGGRVNVTSRVGEGTEVRLSLPLSMAVTRIMMVETCGSLYGVPMDMIVETVRVPADRIRTIKSAETFVLRDMIIPLIRIATLLNLPSTDRDTEIEEAVMVCRVNGNNVGLVIDNFREGMDIILKPLEGILTGIHGYSGTALLGDGRVLLVLDLKELI